MLASRMTEAVSPAAEDPFPEVYTAMGAVLEANLRNCDLAVDGSPSRRTLMSPRRCVPSGILCGMHQYLTHITLCMQSCTHLSPLPACMF